VRPEAEGDAGFGHPCLLRHQPGPSLTLRRFRRVDPQREEIRGGWEDLLGAILAPQCHSCAQTTLMRTRCRKHGVGCVRPVSVEHPDLQRIVGLCRQPGPSPAKSRNPVRRSHSCLACPPCSHWPW
jgi:hypothetical protein